MGSTKVKKCLNIVVYCFLAALIIGGCDIKKKISDVPKYSVTYDINGGTGSGTVPVTAPVDNNTYAVGEEVTAKSMPGVQGANGVGLSNWATQNNGGGTTVVPGGTIRMVRGGLTLYAIYR